MCGTKLYLNFYTTRIYTTKTPVPRECKNRIHRMCEYSLNIVKVVFDNDGFLKLKDIFNVT